MIEVKSLSFSYGKEPVLKDVSFSYDNKDLLAIIGPNGGGKSTLLKLLLGLLKPDSGEIKILGAEPKKSAKLIGYVPQHIPINSAFPISVLEVVLMGVIDRNRFYTKKDRVDALQALETVGMSEFANRRISELSGGQRQRVYIARALVSKAKMLFLDEPTASIDTKGQVEIYNILERVNESGVGVVMISHDLNVAINYATKVAYVNKSLVMHDIDISKRGEFLKHLDKNHKHYCDVELILQECSCKKF
ncbi:MAG: ABC transporter ATP-binding protein [Campylobacteraceae bacterium]|nr:ABC transporter ATP-binding protein [Campylobacteraceae bacterium]